MRQHAEIINSQLPNVEPTPQLVQSTGQWVTSAPNVHEPLVDERTFHRAQPGPTEHSLGAADPADAPPSVA